MTQPLRIRQVQVYPLAIPMRFRFEHAAAARTTADPVIVRLVAEVPYAGHAGCGETLARRYVTGETQDSVVEDVCHVLTPRLLDFRPGSFAEALEFIDALPTLYDRRRIHAARAAVELALLDLACRVFERRMAEAAAWLDLPGFGPPGCRGTARYSGIVVGRAPRRLAAFLRLQRCYGLRDFKLKVAVDGWEQRLEAACRVLRPAIDAGRATLRVDANGGWSYEQAVAALPLLERCGVSAIEQPLPRSDDEKLPLLREQTRCDLIADESLLTIADAERLAVTRATQVLDIRLAKNGGLLPALRIASLALAAGLDVELGCMVGETSLLASAGVAFLEACPQVRFVEGAYARWLLRGDVGCPPIRFHRGGRMRALPGFGLGVDVDPAALEQFRVTPPAIVNL